MPTKGLPRVKVLTKILMHTQKIEEMVDFYRAIGISPIRRFQHDGFVHVQLKVPGFELWILEGEEDRAPKPHGSGSTWIGFEVASLTSTMAAAQRVKAEVLFTRHTAAERRAVLLDPDGRPLDLTERTRPEGLRKSQ